MLVVEQSHVEVVLDVLANKTGYETDMLEMDIRSPTSSMRGDARAMF